MPALISAFRISMIWIDVDLAAPVSQGPLSKLRVPAEYETIVDTLRTSNGYGDGLRLPWWRKTPPHFFWLYYFERLLPEAVDGHKAWQNLAPLQLGQPLAKLAQTTDVIGEMRGYVSPLATAIVAELKGLDARALDPWVDRCHAIRNDELIVSIDGEAHAITRETGPGAVQTRVTGTAHDRDRAQGRRSNAHKRTDKGDTATGSRGCRLAGGMAPGRCRSGERYSAAPA
jgi:hypothetical protein